MSLQYKQVVQNLGLGAAGTQVTIVGAGFTPKAVFAFSNGRGDAVNQQAVSVVDRMFGFGKVGATRCLSSHSETGVSGAAINEDAQNRSDTLLIMIDTNGVVAGQVDLSSFNSDGCVLNIAHQFPRDIQVMFVFVGGSDLTDVAVGTAVMPTVGSAPFTQDITGLGFNPSDTHSAAFFLNTSNVNDNDNSVDSDIGFGAFVSATQQGILLAGTNNGAGPSVSKSVCTDEECIANLSTSLSSQNRRAQGVQWITDGFRIQHNEISSEAVYVYYMVLNGGFYAIKPFATAAALSDVVVTGVGVGTPVGGMVFSSAHLESSVDSVQDDATMSIGAFSSPTSRACMSSFMKNGQATLSLTTGIRYDQVYEHLDETSAILGLMDVKTIDGDGVTFTMDDADPSTCFGWTVLFGSVSGGPPPPSGIGFDLDISVLCRTNDQLFTAVFSRGHTAGDAYPTVVDNDVGGQAWTRIAASADRKASLFTRRATSQTAGKKITVAGCITQCGGGVAIYDAVLPDIPGPVYDHVTVTVVTGLSTTAGFTPDKRCSNIVMVLFTVGGFSITSPRCTNPGVMPIRFEKIDTTSVGLAVNLSSEAQPFAVAPAPTGNFSWTGAPDYMIALALRPVPGAGTNYATATIVDTDTTNTLTDSARPLFGTSLGAVYTIDEGELDFNGVWLSKQFGKDQDNITLDRVYVVATATEDSVVGVSFTFDGGATFSEEIVVPIPVSNNGSVLATGWETVTGSLFQIRVRPRSGDAIVHKVKIYAQPRGRVG